MWRWVINAHLVETKSDLEFGQPAQCHALPCLKQDTPASPAARHSSEYHCQAHSNAYEDWKGAAQQLVARVAVRLSFDRCADIVVALVHTEQAVSAA